MMVIHRNDKFTSSSLISHVIMIMAYEVERNYYVKRRYEIWKGKTYRIWLRGLSRVW